MPSFSFDVYRRLIVFSMCALGFKLHGKIKVVWTALFPFNFLHFQLFFAPSHLLYGDQQVGKNYEAVRAQKGFSVRPWKNFETIEVS